jgi:hypothetical protein
MLLTATLFTLAACMVDEPAFWFGLPPTTTCLSLASVSVARATACLRSIDRSDFTPSERSEARCIMKRLQRPEDGHVDCLHDPDTIVRLLAFKHLTLATGAARIIA